MKKIINLFGLLFFLLFSSTSFSQTADEVIDKYIETIGGKEKLLSIHSMQYTGSQNYYGIYESIVITEVHDSLLRYDIEAYDKKGFWMVTKNIGGEFFPWENDNKKYFSEAEVKVQQGALNIYDPLLSFKQDTATAHYIGIKKVDSIPCYFLYLEYPSGKRVYYWFDSETHLLKQSQKYYRMITSQNDKLNSNDLTKFSAWRDIDGVLFPFIKTTDVFVNKVKVAQKSFFFTDIQINPIISPKLYRIP
jgi:hypothetical protein